MARKPDIGNVVLYPDRALRPSDKNGYVLKFYCPLQRQRIRRNCGTRDRRVAKGILRECKTRLLNGAYVNSRGAITASDERNLPLAVILTGDELKWDTAVEAFHETKALKLRPKSIKEYKSRLSIATQALKSQVSGPLLLADALSLASLERLQDLLIGGEASRLDVRSPHTVNSVMRAVMTFSRFCHRHKWITELPPLATVPTDEAMKGRPITGEEFDRMMEAIPKVVGDAGADEWRFMLNLLMESGFRIGDLMDFHWEDAGHIHPVWPTVAGQHATIIIPPTQKNGKWEEIPMIPGLRKLLETVPESRRRGWVVNPPPVEYQLKTQHDWFMPSLKDLAKLAETYSNSSIGRACGVSETTVRKWFARLAIQPAQGRPSGVNIPPAVIATMRSRAGATTRHVLRLKGRMTVERVGRIICKIGKAARVIVRKEDKATGQKTKYGSAHDLRRSCAERLANAGISAETLRVVFRHRDFATTEKFYGAKRKAQAAGNELQVVLAGCKKNQLVGGLVGGLEALAAIDPEKLKKLTALLETL